MAMADDDFFDDEAIAKGIQASLEKLFSTPVRNENIPLGDPDADIAKATQASLVERGSDVRE